MSWENRRPTVRLIITRTLFNKLLGVLEANIGLEYEEDGISEKARQLKENLLVYSVPKTFEKDKNEYVEIGFFPTEASNMIRQFLIRAHSYHENVDYYKILLKNRENKKLNKKVTINYSYFMKM